MFSLSFKDNTLENLYKEGSVGIFFSSHPLRLPDTEASQLN